MNLKLDSLLPTTTAAATVVAAALAAGAALGGFETTILYSKFLVFYKWSGQRGIKKTKNQLIPYTTRVQL